MYVFYLNWNDCPHQLMSNLLVNKILYLLILLVCSYEIQRYRYLVFELSS
jgi:hypothetical protein